MFSQSQEEVKLEWMYKGPHSSVDREEYLLGRSVDKTLEQLNDEEKRQHSGAAQQSKNHVEHECIPPSIRDYKEQVGEQVDLAAKLQEDPLIAIKKREEENRRQFLNNPIQIKKLQKALKSEKKKKKKKKTYSSDTDSEDNLNKKLAQKLKSLTGNTHKKKSKKNTDNLDTILMHKYNQLKGQLSDKDLRDIFQGKSANSSSSDDSDDNKEKSSSENDSDEMRINKERSIYKRKLNRSWKHSNDQKFEENVDRKQTQKSNRAISRSDSEEKHEEHHNTSRSKKRRSRSSSMEMNNKKSTKYTSRKQSEEALKHKRYLSSAESDARMKYNKKSEYSHREQRQHLEKSKRRSRSTSNERGKWKREDGNSSKDRLEIKGSRYISEGKDSKHGSKAIYKEDKYHNKHDFSEYKADSKDARHDEKYFRSIKEKPKKDKSSDSDSSSSCSDTATARGRVWGLVKADGTKLTLPAELVIKKSNSAVRPSSKTQEVKVSEIRKHKPLTEDEKEKKRREMMENAAWRDMERIKNVKQYREKEKKEAEKQKDYDPKFLHKELLKSANNSSVESRIRSNINNIQRSGNDMNKHFSRRQ